LKTKLYPTQSLILPFIYLNLILKVEAKRITITSLWTEIAMNDQTAESLKYELAFLSRVFSCSAYLQVTRALVFKI